MASEVLYWFWIYSKGFLKHLKGILKIEIWLLMNYPSDTMFKHLSCTELYFNKGINQESPFVAIANRPFTIGKYFLCHKSIYHQVSEMNDGVSNISIDQPNQLFISLHWKILIGEDKDLIECFFIILSLLIITDLLHDCGDWLFTNYCAKLV